MAPQKRQKHTREPAQKVNKIQKKFFDKKKRTIEEALPPAKPEMNAYKRAEKVYQQVQKKRQEESEQRQRNREEFARKQEEYLSLRKKMDKALMKRTKRGQPKLNSQMVVLLEKIERRMKR